MELVRTMDNFRRLEEKIIEYLYRNHVGKGDAENGKSEFGCGYCEKVYQTGRQLGGHVSRKHEGRSDAFNRKKKIHKAKTMERARRNYFNPEKGITAASTPKKVKKPQEKKPTPQKELEKKIEPHDLIHEAIQP